MQIRALEVDTPVEEAKIWSDSKFIYDKGCHHDFATDRDEDGMHAYRSNRRRLAYSSQSVRSDSDAIDEHFLDGDRDQMQQSKSFQLPAELRD